MPLVRSLIAAILLAAVAQPVAAAAVVLDFEELVEGDEISTQYTGVTFSNALVLTAGSLLNEIEFPPASGVNVVTAFAPDVVELVFTTPVTSFRAALTYNGRVTLDALDGNGDLVATQDTAFDDNLATGPNQPNEVLQVSGGAITRIRLSSSGEFVFDDVTFEPGQAVPEPTTALLLAVGAVAAARRRRP